MPTPILYIKSQDRSNQILGLLISFREIFVKIMICSHAKRNTRKRGCEDHCLHNFIRYSEKRTSAPSVPRFFKSFSTLFETMIQSLRVPLFTLYINILIIKSIYNGTFGTICIYADSVRVPGGPLELDLLVRIFSSFFCKPPPPRAFQRTSSV
jgi:hypothetical protein